MNIKHILVAAIAVASWTGCVKKDNPVATPETGVGNVKMEFFNIVGTSALNLGNQWYKNAHGDSFQVTKLNYYISNIRLNGTDTTYVEPESYHLIMESDATSRAFDLSNVPYGTYSSVTLMIGVDSLRNVSGAQTGALDPSYGMFWTWNTGYIMFKFEGVSPVSPNVGGTVAYHAGGYSGQYAVQRTLTLNFPNTITVAKEGENHIHVTGDLLNLFKSPTEYNFAMQPDINTPGRDAKNLADNYATMFTVTAAGL